MTLRDLRPGRPAIWLVALPLLVSPRPAHSSPADAGHRPSGLPEPPRVVFVTSVTGTGDLGSWPDAGTATGVAAGDEICRTRAALASLPAPGDFVAWLSDSSNDAYCRLHNLAGTKATNCGQPTLPASAGPWVRTDDFPFSEEITQLLSPNGVVYSALQLDEFGAPVPPHAILFTATNTAGTLATGSSTCGDWTDTPAALVTVGNEQQTTGGWTQAGDAYCSDLYRLICMETIAGPALEPIQGVGRLAFVTSAHGSGDLSSWAEAGGSSGIAAGDAICQALAAQAGLGSPATFKAWLSTSSTDAVDRFVHDGPWARLDGVTVADGKIDLTDGVLAAPINVTEQGAYLGNEGVWTGTDSSGLGTGDDCSDWSDDDGSIDASYGRVNDLRDWTELAFITATCDTSAFHLYCLSDAPLAVPIFADGFESGDASAWSATVP